MRLRNPTICHLQAREPGKSTVQFGLSPKAREPEAQISEDRRKRTSQLKQRANSLFLHCCVLFDWVMTIHAGRAVLLYSVFWKQPHRHAQKCFTSLGVFLRPVKLTQIQLTPIPGGPVSLTDIL